MVGASSLFDSDMVITCIRSAEDERRAAARREPMTHLYPRLIVHSDGGVDYSSLTAFEDVFLDD